MERRLEKRFSSGLEIQITEIDGAASATGTLLNVSESGICALLPDRLAVGALLKLDLADTVLYGQVAYSTEENGGFRTGVSVERVLVQASDLSSILAVLLDDAPVDRPIRS